MAGGTAAKAAHPWKPNAAGCLLKRGMHQALDSRRVQGHRLRTDGARAAVYYPQSCALHISDFTLHNSRIRTVCGEVPLLLHEILSNGGGILCPAAPGTAWSGHSIVAHAVSFFSPFCCQEKNDKNTVVVIMSGEAEVRTDGTAGRVPWHGTPHCCSSVLKRVRHRTTWARAAHFQF